MALPWIEQKRHYRRYKARIAHLPAGYREVAAALERYIYCLGGLGEADSVLALLDDLADLFEQAAANRTPIRDIVGEDPVEFAEAFLLNYRKGRWVSRERERLTSAVDRAVAAENTGNEGASR